MSINKKAVLGKGIASLLGASAQVTTQVEQVSVPEKSKTVPRPVIDAALKQIKQQEERIADKIVEKEVDGPIGPTMIEVSKIGINPYQPRKIFDEQELIELSKSIKENGIIQPLIVSKTEDGYELIAGERRLRAAKVAGLAKVPVVVKRATDRERLVMAIIENVQRSDLNCIEEGHSYFKLMDEFNLTQEEVAQKIGKERSTIANFLRILKLPKQVIDFIQKDLISFGHAKILASLKESEEILRFANEIVSKKLSVRELENLIKNQKPVGSRLSSIDEEELEKVEQIRQQLEKRTGLHISISNKKDGSGFITLKYHSEDEFNKIYDFLSKK